MKMVIENIALFPFSDYGVRCSLIVEVNKAIWIYLTDKYKQKYEERIKFFFLNSNQFTTPSDIYQTIRDLACIVYDKNGKYSMDPVSSIIRLDLYGLRTIFVTYFSQKCMQLNPRVNFVFAI